ncbi:MAG: class I mannose-6-phosphate isomerase [Candidatus Abyssubacteria bacterium]
MKLEPRYPDTLYPLLLQPIFKHRIWGGRRLETVLGKNLPPNQPIGESWELSCRDDDNNIIRNGPLADKTLRDIFTTEKEALVGPRFRNAAKFPLLNKFIDANDLLSVQVHPNEECARRFPDAEAKTEAWYIIHAEPGASLIKGLKPGVTRQSFENAIRDGTVPDTLNQFPVSARDMVFVPAGCVHAMGKGLIVCEIQQNSDTTYRVYDWDRLGSDGKPRQIHVQQALETVNFNDRSPDKVATIAVLQGRNLTEYLVVCPYFSARLLRLEEPQKESTRHERFESLMITNGQGAIRAKNGETRFVAGDSVLIPAAVGEYTIVPSGQCSLLKTYVPTLEDELRELRSKEIAEETIRAIVFD